MKATFKQVKVVPKTGRFEPELVKGLRNEIDKHKSTAEIELCSLGTSSVTRSEMLRDRFTNFREMVVEGAQAV